jgi:hypothetical protein
MDRISALRNVEDALSAYENGELRLPELEREVRGVLRTYATEFDEETTAYRARGEPPADGVVVVARSPTEARERVEEFLADPATTNFEVERVE